MIAGAAQPAPRPVAVQAPTPGTVAEIPNPPAVALAPASPVARMTAGELDWEDLLGRTWFDQAKTVLALFGLLTLMIGFLRRDPGGVSCCDEMLGVVLACRLDDQLGNVSPRWQAADHQHGIA